MLVLGLTGNIGCGKSSVSTIFMENNIKVVVKEKFYEKEI